MMQSKKFRALAMVGALTMAVCTGTTAMAEEVAPMGNSPEIQKIFRCQKEGVPSVSFKFTLEKVTAVHQRLRCRRLIITATQIKVI